MVRHLGLEARALRGQRRDLDVAATRPVAVDAFLVYDPFDLVECGEHRTLHRDRRFTSMGAHGAISRAGEERRAPPAVAARRAEADVLALTDHDTELRIRREQRVRGPQPGVTRADDRDVGVDVARKW